MRWFEFRDTSDLGELVTQQGVAVAYILLPRLEDH